MPKKNSSKINGGLTQAHEVFLNQLILGDSQRQAYLKAYPSRVTWKPNALDTGASLLFKQERMQKRYKELLEIYRKDEQENALWTRENSIKSLKYVINQNKIDLERTQEAYEQELDYLIQQIEEHPESAPLYTRMLVEARKQRRMANVYNKGIVDAVAELNKMQGFNEETINLNGTVIFEAEEELED